MADGLEQQLKLLGKAIPRSAIEHQRIALVGASPEGIGAVPDGLGVFEKRSDSKRMNGAPTYILLGSEEKTVMWRASGGAWLVGSTKEEGSSNGSIRAKDSTEAPTPDSITSSCWKFRDEKGTYREAPTVRCIAGEELELEYASATNLIALVGSTPGNIQRDCLGLFERSKSEFVNGYPTYHIIGTDGNDILWHAGSCWIVGNREDLGAKKGGLLCYDGSLKPECIAAGLWEVMDLKNEWVAAPEVRVVFGAQLEFERRSAAMTVALVGATPRQLHGSFVGIFERLPNRVNGLPTYKSKGSGEGAKAVLMWHAGSYWFVGNFARSAGGQMRAADGALRAECVAACWEVWDGKAGKGGRGAWVEAPELRCLPKHRIVQAVEEIKAADRSVARRQQLRRTVSAIGRLEKQTKRPIAG